jgi:hypothetical protein
MSYIKELCSVNKINIHKTFIIFYLTFYLFFAITVFSDIDIVFSSALYAYSNNWGLANYDVARMLCYVMLFVNIVIGVVILIFIFINKNAMTYIIFFSSFHTIMLVAHLLFLTNKYPDDILFSLIIIFCIMPLMLLYISLLNTSK